MPDTVNRIPFSTMVLLCSEQNANWRELVYVFICVGPFLKGERLPVSFSSISLMLNYVTPTPNSLWTRLAERD